jgi:peptide/nickel transport system substrate-binding protein
MQTVVILGLVLALVIFAPSSGSLGQQLSAPRGELRIVDHSPLNWAWVTWQVFEHLIEFDPDGKLIPRLATGWQWLDDKTIEFKLRRGVKFHNGEPFDTEAVRLNWEENTRHTQPHLLGSYLNFKPGSRLEIVDADTIRFRFPEPDGAALVKIGAMHMASREFYRKVGWGEKHW